MIPWIGAGFTPPTVDEAWLDGIDPPIRALVAALNRTGWARTVFSCSGHPEEPDSVVRGRCQAHLDLLIQDQSRWKHFINTVRSACSRHVEQGKPVKGELEVKVVEGPLGQVPDSLNQQLGDARSWSYRRLVFEPVPYDAPPERCRMSLDAALSAALSTLDAPEGFRP